MRNLTEKSGEALYFYIGRGYVNNIACDFEVVQLANGTIIICCEAHELLHNSKTGDVELKGNTFDGITIEAFGKAILENSSLHFGGDQPHKYCFRSSGFFEIRVYEDVIDDVVRLEFGLVNFEFWGNETEHISNAKIALNKLRHELDGVEICFKQLDSYNEILENLKSKKDVNVTCELIFEIGNQSLQEVFALVDVICNLLTIARGRKINWIYHKSIDANGSTLTIHQPRITSEFKGFELIDFQHKETLDFLDQCYPAYMKLNSTYHFDHIANILSDCHASGFLETRCLAMFSVVDSLVKRVSQDRQLRRRIQAFVKHHKIPISESEISNFIDSRNKLTHELEFFSSDYQTEYFDNLHFLHRLILGALGYSSYYINVTRHPLYTGSKADKLTPTS